jgi:hypothetical protein
MSRDLTSCCTQQSHMRFLQFPSKVNGRLRRVLSPCTAVRRHAAHCSSLPCPGVAPLWQVSQRTHKRAQALLASPFLPPSQLPGLLTRIAALNRRPTRPAASSNASSSAAAPAAECVDVTVSEILAAVQKSALEVCDMARVGAATAAMLPLLQSTGRFSCMRAHARAAAAALVLAQDDALIQELCRRVTCIVLQFPTVCALVGVDPCACGMLLSA